MDENLGFESGLEADNESEIIESLKNDTDAADDSAADGHDDWNDYQ